MYRCKKCFNYILDSDICTCESYQVYYPDYFGEGKETIHAHSFEDAVERIAEKINSDDPIYDKDIFEIPVIVTDKNGFARSFNCVAMIDVNYSVREL